MLDIRYVLVLLAIGRSGLIGTDGLVFFAVVGRIFLCGVLGITWTSLSNVF